MSIDPAMSRPLMAMHPTHYILLLFLVLIIFPSIFAIAGAQVSQRNCTYEVTIETTCTKGAETSNHVSLRFGDSKSNDILIRHLNSKHVRRVDPLDPQILDDVPRKPFQACITDQFRVERPCVDSPVCYLYLKLAGDDDWRPGFAQVQVLEGPELSSKYFYFRRYLPRRVWHGADMCDTEVTPFGIKYKRKIFAANKHAKLLIP